MWLFHGHVNMYESIHIFRSFYIIGLGARGEGDDRGWDGWMASLTRWTWVSENSRSWWWTGRPGVPRFMGSQRVGYDWATDLIWYYRMFPWWLKGKESLGQEDPLEKEIATCSWILAWRIPWTEELAGYSPWGRKRVRHDLATKQQQNISRKLLVFSFCLFFKYLILNIYFLWGKRKKKAFLKIHTLSLKDLWSR